MADFCSYGPSCNKLRGFSQKSKIFVAFKKRTVPHGISVGHYLVVTNNTLHYKHFLPVTELASSERVETSLAFIILVKSAVG